MMAKIVCKQGNNFRCIETEIEPGETTNQVQSRLMAILSQEIETCILCQSKIESPFSEPDVLPFSKTDYIYFRTFAGIYCNSCMKKALREAVQALGILKK